MRNEDTAIAQVLKAMDALDTANLGDEKKEAIDWKRAFVVLCVLLSTDFVTTSTINRYVDRIRKVAGDEPADLFVFLFNNLRSKIAQDFMG